MHSEVGDNIDSLRIKKFVVDKINNNFEDKVMDSQITENYSMPCFYVYLGDSEIHSKNISQDEIQTEINIQYQNKNFKEHELNNINEKLRSLFDYVQQVDNTRVLITDMYSTVEDYNLYLNVNVNYRQSKPKINKKYEITKKINVEVKQWQK